MTSTEAREPLLQLYLHFPFCAHVCHYCDYAAEASARPPVEQWVGAVDQELALRLGRDGVPPGSDLATVYVGGGTPSLLGAAGMDALAAALSRRFRMEAADVEWTVEANPSSLDRDTAAAWRAAGVNRLSLGVQSFDDRALRWLGRLHDAGRARDSIAAARAGGLEEVSVDLLYGLPPGVERDWAGDLQWIRELEIPHVSLYGLTVGEDTPLGGWIGRGKVASPSEDRAAAEYLHASRVLEEGGWEHYETGSFARAGHRSRYGEGTWAGRPTLAVGPSAHGRLPPWRYRNVARWDEYRRSVRRRGLPEIHRETPDGASERAERIWLRLRTREGITGDLARWVRREHPSLVHRLQEAGWLRSDTVAVAPTPEGWLRLDDMAAALVPDPGDGRRTNATAPGPAAPTSARENQEN